MILPDSAEATVPVPLPPQAPVVPPSPMVLPLPADGPGSLEFWHGQIGSAKEDVKRLLPFWRKNLKRYEGEKTPAAGFSEADTIQVNVDFEKTEQKKAQLSFRTPDVVLSPKNPDSAAAVPIFSAVINQQLGPEFADALSAFDECLTDVLCPAGIAWVKVGYSGSVNIDPVTQQTTVESGEYYIERGSPAALLIPSDFIRSNYNKADWLGFRSFRDEAELATIGDVQPLSSGASAGSDDDILLTTSGPRPTRMGKWVTEIWYWAWRIDATQRDRRVVRHLILVDGEDLPRVHQDSPWQRRDPATGNLVGVMGLPVKVLTLRYASDQHFPKSDCQMSRAAVDELSQTRTIQMQQKRRALPMRGIDKSRMTDPATIAKIEQGEVQSIIWLDGNPSEIIQTIALPTLPRDTAVAGDIITGDIDRLWRMNQNRSGVTESGSKTATELTFMNQATDVALDKERSKVEAWQIAIISTLGGLLQLFQDDTQYVELVGQDGAKRMQAWNRQDIPGEFIYSIKPDSAKRLDQNTERKMALDRYQLTANDPYNNRMESLRDVYTAFGEDPQRHLQQPPAPPPEKARISLSFKAEDLTNPMVISLLQQSGYQIDPSAVKMELAFHSQHPGLLAEAASHPGATLAAPPVQAHGGSAQEQAPLNKHALEANIGGHR